MWPFTRKKKKEEKKEVQEEREVPQTQAVEEKPAPVKETSAKANGSKKVASTSAKPKQSTTSKTAKQAETSKKQSSTKSTAQKSAETKKSTSKATTKETKSSEEGTRKSIYRVVYDKEARVWLIKKDGAKRTIASFKTKEEALNRVKELSETQDLNFVVHKKDGKFQKKS